MTITPADILNRARELISKPNSWTQRTFARDAEGMPVISQSTQAVCFCSMGAIQRASTELNPMRWEIVHAEAHALNALVNSIPDAFFGDIVVFNDSYNTDQNHVLAAFDKAIEYAN